MKEKIRIMLVEDSNEYRHVIQFAFRDEPGFELAGVFGTAEQALRSLKRQAARVTPDVVLLDLNLPGISGLEALPELIKLAPETKVLILTQSETEADVLGTIKMGASGYLLKSSSIQEIRSGIRTVAAGGASMDSRMALYLLKTFRKDPVLADNDSILSEREMEILQLISQGLARKEIADELDISHKTVANHIAHIFEKLNVPNSPAAINKAHEKGLLGGDDRRG
ncbi:response regulator [Roseibacillus persicicus]|uniref:DNA-binding response regulator n=1 Tax=Roseibacillus persicicus TaxID=454148 RepID=A0A918TMM0_9BACT|nr:response regulator transcription factor [Roseibacillus persicicus]MDQ8189032.1 response regulator transcription factor [Roseibacillus persicicus]GHC52780.1 DNA-binding response regulator [Roseibacillus persicicus]